jgi:L-lactate dehydrogenase complex protein LldE
MIAHRYPELFAGEPRYAEAARELAGRTYELSQYLVDVLKLEPPAAAGGRRLTYHASCHLARGLRASDGARRLLAKAAGDALVPLAGEQDCCGFGGLFAVDMSDISGAMLERKIAHILETGASAVVACDAGCLLQIEGGLRRHSTGIEALHLAEVLAGDD